MASKVEVVAVAQGFYAGVRRRPGATFSVEAHEVEKTKWFRPVSDGPIESLLATNPILAVLDKSVSEIVPTLADFTVQELRDLCNAEMAGKTRKSLVAAINDEIANRELNPDDGGGDLLE